MSKLNLFRSCVWSQNPMSEAYLMFGNSGFQNRKPNVWHIPHVWQPHQTCLTHTSPFLPTIPGSMTAKVDRCMLVLRPTITRAEKNPQISILLLWAHCLINLEWSLRSLTLLCNQGLQDKIVALKSVFNVQSMRRGREVYRGNQNLQRICSHHSQH